MSEGINRAGSHFVYSFEAGPSGRYGEEEGRYIVRVIMQSPECSQSRLVAAFVSASVNPRSTLYEFIYAATRCRPLPASPLPSVSLPISIVMCVWSFLLCRFVAYCCIVLLV